MINNLPLSDLIRLAMAGGGMYLDASNRSLGDILRIAEAAKSGSCTLFLSGIRSLPIQDLLRVASAGGGNVVLKD